MTMFKSVEPTPAMEAARLAMIEGMRKHQDQLSADQMLAVAAHLVGQLVALQDQTVMTPAMAMKLVSENIQAGNQNAIAGLYDLEIKGSA